MYPLYFCLGNDRAAQGEVLPEDLLSGWMLMRKKNKNKNLARRKKQEAEI